MNEITKRPELSSRQSKKSIATRAVWKTAIVIAIATAIGVSAHLITSESADAQPVKPVPSVAVSHPLDELISPRLDFVGQLSAVQKVDLRAQVGGTLNQIRFTDGDIVRRGDVLFEIDPTPYQIALSHAKATYEGAKARLTLAAQELARATKLKNIDAGTAERVDQATADKLAAQAAVDAAAAQVRDAQFDLDHCVITAPFTGRIGDHLVSVGNIVSGNRTGAGSTTLLATIVSVDPVYVNFDMSESDYMAFLRSRHGDTGPVQQRVEIALTGDSRFSRNGTMTFVDNALDPSSGTIHARATIANTDHMLTPGGFARVRVELSSPTKTLLVPDEAVFPDQADHEVFVVGADDVVSVKSVRIGSLHGDLRVIESGLKPTDRVIVSGLAAVRPGEKVAPKAKPIELPSIADAN